MSQEENKEDSKMSLLNKKQECQKCGTTFQYFGNRLRHELTCKGAFNQKCPLCFNEFKNKYSLTYHIKMCIARQELALKTKNSASEDEKQNTVKGMKKWKYCFFESCYCSFNKFSQLLTHIYSCHPNTAKYGFLMHEFDTMTNFESWLEEEMARTGDVFTIRTKKNNSCELACESQEKFDYYKVKKFDGKLARLLSDKKLCTSRILITPYKDKYICTYLTFHTHDLKLDDINALEEKEWYNKLKGYICLGVEMDDIYKQLIIANGCEDVDSYNRLYGEVKKLLKSVKERILGDKLNKQQIDTDESDDGGLEMKVEHENVIEIKSEHMSEVIQIPMEGVEDLNNVNNFEIAEVENNDGSGAYEVTIKSDQGVFGEHLYCQVPEAIQLDVPENVTPEMLQNLPIIAEGKDIENQEPQPEIILKPPSKFKIKKGEIKQFLIKKKKTEQLVMKNVFSGRIIEEGGEVNANDVPQIHEERIKSFLMERKKIEDELVKKIFSKKGNNIIEEALKISNIIPSEQPQNVETTYTPPKKPNVEDVKQKAESISAKTVERSENDLGVTLKEKMDLIRKNLNLIEKYLDSPLIADEEVLYINTAVDDIVRKCEIHRPQLVVDIENTKIDGTRDILPYLNYTKLEHIVMTLRENVKIQLIDFFTLLSSNIADKAMSILQKAKKDFTKCELPPSIINAYFIRFIETDRNAKETAILVDSDMASYLQSNQEVSKNPKLQDLFKPENLKNKTHMYVPCQYENEENHQQWILLVFHLEFHFYGILNPSRGFEIKQHSSIRNVISGIKKNLPKSTWRNMEYIRSYQLSKTESGVYICYYLERLVKKLPLTASINGPLYRYFIFETIKGNCMCQSQFDHKKCGLCKLHIISKNDKVSCKYCKVPFHISCVKSTDADFVCPPQRPT